MKRKNFKFFLALTVVVVSVFFLASKFSVYQPSSVGFVQYTGYLSKSWFDDKISVSKTVELGDYKFSVQTFDQYLVDYGCQPNSCGGSLDHYDEFNCPVYKKTVSYFTCPNREDKYYGCSSSGCNYPQYLYCQGACIYCERGWSYHRSTVYCGGKFIECYNPERYVNWGCSYSVDVYKNSDLIKTIGYHKKCGSNITGSSSYLDDEIDASFGNSKWYEYRTCKSILNTYTLKIPSGELFFNITPSKEFYYTGENATLDFTITNDWKNGLYAKSYLEMCIPTIFGNKCKTFTKEFDLPLGTKTTSFEIPTRQVTDKIILKPSVEIFLDANSYNLKGLNIHPYSIINSNGETCSKHFNGRTTVISVDLCKNAGYNLISLGKVNGNQSEVQIVPQIVQPTVPTIWDKIKIFFSDILLWIAGLFNW